MVGGFAGNQKDSKASDFCQRNALDCFADMPIFPVGTLRGETTLELMRDSAQVCQELQRALARLPSRTRRTLTGNSFITTSEWPHDARDRAHAACARAGAGLEPTVAVTLSLSLKRVVTAQRPQPAKYATSWAPERHHVRDRSKA